MSEHRAPNSSSMLSKRSSRGLALLLIGVGMLIFVNQSGVLGAAVWSALWPLGLIAVGLDLIWKGQHRRRIAMGTLMGVLVVTPLVGGAQLFGAAAGSGATAASRSLTLDSNVRRVRAHVKLTAGDVQIRSLSQESDQVAQFGSDVEISNYTPNEDGTAVLDINSDWRGRDLDLRLTRRVPLELVIELGAGNLQPLDLEDLQLEKLDLKLDAGNTEVRLPQQGVMDVTVTGGWGTVVIDVPDQLAARIVIDQEWGKTEIDERFKQQSDGAYISADYSDTAKDRATIHVTETGGAITIK